MPRLRLDLDRETYDALASQALAQRRPVILQAEVILRQTLGLPFPYPRISFGVDDCLPSRVASHE